MRYYPVNLDIQNRSCLVVGGGSVAERKVRTLLECRAVVSVVSLTTTAYLNELLAQGKIDLHKRPYAAADLDGVFLVIGATDDEVLNQRISMDARQRNLLCNIADRPEACNFILPSLVSRGDLIIAISTSGKSPAFAKKLRQRLEAEFGEEYSVFLKLMGAIRKRLLSTAHAPEAHKHLFEKLIEGGLIDMVREQREDDINDLLHDILGDGYEMGALLEGSIGSVHGKS